MATIPMASSSAYCNVSFAPSAVACPVAGRRRVCTVNAVSGIKTGVASSGQLTSIPPTVNYEAFSSNRPKSGCRLLCRSELVPPKARDEAREDRLGAATEVVLKFYDAINRRDIDAALTNIAEECVYEDMIYSNPFVGREDIGAFFRKVLEKVPEDFIFVIDDISVGEDSCGMVWHAETNGKPFPFGRGCSFYRCKVKEGRPQIVYGRDIPETLPKPGDTALIILKYIGKILKRFPSLLP